ncbi:MAG: YdcF family protein [Bryobacteraceae bacterium]|jgi:uncharacterized SAM-binding protein YcdF (DUF218 family)
MNRFFSRSRLILLAALILGPALLYLDRTDLLADAGNLLIVRDKLEPADIIFLLNGDATSRPYYAAELFHKGLASKVVIARMEDSRSVQLGAYPNPTDSNLVVLRKLGVPESGIVELRPERGVMHTADEAMALLAYLRDNPIHKVIVVTSEFHSRRSKYMFRKALQGTDVRVMLAPTRDVKYGANDWWHIEDGILGCQNEYIKLLYYYYRY